MKSLNSELCAAQAGCWELRCPFIAVSFQENSEFLIEGVEDLLEQLECEWRSSFLQDNKKEADGLGRGKEGLFWGVGLSRVWLAAGFGFNLSFEEYCDKSVFIQQEEGNLGLFEVQDYYNLLWLAKMPCRCLFPCRFCYLYWMMILLTLMSFAWNGDSLAPLLRS